MAAPRGIETPEPVSGDPRDDATVTPIRTASNTALPSIKVGGYPVAIAITPDGRTACVVNGGNGRPGWVTPIRIAGNTAIRPIRVGGSPTAILITR